MSKALHCRNCSSPATGRYCPSCGQRQLERLTVPDLTRDFAARFFSAESGLWRTVRGLATRPGRTVRGYLDGRRRQFVGPLGFYAICAGLQVLSIWTLADYVADPVIAQLPTPYFDYVAERGVADPAEWARGRVLAVMQSSYSWLGLFTLVLPMALLARLILWGRATLAEVLAATLFNIAFAMLVTAFSAQILIRTSSTAHAVFSLGLYALHAVVTFTGCFGRDLRAAVAGLLSIVLAGVCFVIALQLATGFALMSGFPN